MRPFIVGLMLGFLMTIVGSMLVIQYKLRKNKMIKEILNERNHYKDFYEKYWDERNAGH